MFREYIVTFDQVYGFYPTLTNMVFSFDAVFSILIGKNFPEIVLAYDPKN